MHPDTCPPSPRHIPTHVRTCLLRFGYIIRIVIILITNPIIFNTLDCHIFSLVKIYNKVLKSRKFQFDDPTHNLIDLIVLDYEICVRIYGRYMQDFIYFDIYIYMHDIYDFCVFMILKF